MRWRSSKTTLLETRPGPSHPKITPYLAKQLRSAGRRAKHPLSRQEVLDGRRSHPVSSAVPVGPAQPVVGPEEGALEGRRQSYLRTPARKDPLSLEGRASS
jgi:hypothetical protein